jgi:hypothetical protein
MMGIMPSIVQSIISVILNEFFKPVAAKATQIENHRTQTDFNNSLIIKRFAFNFCDFFLYLFYIGCYELRMDLLRQNLALLFMIDEVRRIVTEAIIPYVANWNAKRKKRKELKGDKKDYKGTPEYIEQKEMEEV